MKTFQPLKLTIILASLILTLTSISCFQTPTYIPYPEPDQPSSQEPAYAPPPTPVYTPEPSTPEPYRSESITVLSDSFVLGQMSYTGECAEAIDFTEVGYPFNKYGLYISDSFFVKDSEIFELIVTADCPIGHARGDAREGIYVDCPQSYKSTLSQSFSLDFDLFESSYLERSGTRWTRTFIIKADKEKDYKWYQIQMYNEGTEAL